MPMSDEERKSAENPMWAFSAASAFSYRYQDDQKAECVLTVITTKCAWCHKELNLGEESVHKCGFIVVNNIFCWIMKTVKNIGGWWNR